VAVLSAIFYTPVALAVIFVTHLGIGIVELRLMAGSAALHSAYFILLNQGYRVGELSLVYPLARGTGPLLSTIAAIVLLGERPAALAVAGALLIIGGVVVITSNTKSLRKSGVKNRGALRGSHRFVHRGLYLVGQAGGEPVRSAASDPRLGR
jgi:drug/metabolite transporter (DMT)-like permease